MERELANILHRRGLRLTRPRLEILHVLRLANHPLRIAEIAKECPQIDRTSVYRTIDLFASIGLVTSVMRGWRQQFELAAPYYPHHHHLVCERCQRLIEIHSDQLEAIVRNLTARHGFRATRHHFEITGLCRQCSAADGQRRRKNIF